MENLANWSINYGGLTKEELLHRLAQNKICLNAYATLLFLSSGFTTSIKSNSVSVVELSPADLGIGNKATFSEITDISSSNGLDLCPLELAPALRLEYQNQIEGPLLTVASEIPKKDGVTPDGFYLQKYSDCLWLRGYISSEDWLWEPDSKFVFIEKNA